MEAFDLFAAAFEWAFLVAFAVDFDPFVALFEDAAMMEFTSDQMKSNVTTITDNEYKLPVVVAYGIVEHAVDLESDDHQSSSEN